jgi:hypothetical protein
MSDICNQLKINPSIFEGYNIPDNIHDMMIFFSTEISNQNNIPFHIKLKVDEVIRNSQILENADEFFRDCRISWFVKEITKQIERDEKNMNMKIDCIYNIICMCMENIDIYKSINNTKFYESCLSKATQVLEQTIDEGHYAKIKCREFIRMFS